MSRQRVRLRVSLRISLAGLPRRHETIGAGAAAHGGATVAMGAADVGMAGAKKTYSSTMGYLADSTAKQIVVYFSQYAANQEWITQDQAQSVRYDQSGQ